MKKLTGEDVIKGKSIQVGDKVYLDKSQYVIITKIYVKYNKKTKSIEPIIEADYFNFYCGLGNTLLEIKNEKWKNFEMNMKNWLRNYYSEQIPYNS